MNTIFNQTHPVQGPQGSAFGAFVSNFMRQFPGTNPQQIGMQLLNSGKISRQDFQRYSDIANRLTGRTTN